MDFMKLWNICDPKGFAKGDDSYFSRSKNIITHRKSSDRNSEKEKNEKKITNDNNCK